jgi:hypothetical protein
MAKDMGMVNANAATSFFMNISYVETYKAIFRLALLCS